MIDVYSEVAAVIGPSIVPAKLKPSSSSIESNPVDYRSSLRESGLPKLLACSRRWRCNKWPNLKKWCGNKTCLHFLSENIQGHIIFLWRYWLTHSVSSRPVPYLPILYRPLYHPSPPPTICVLSIESINQSPVRLLAMCAVVLVRYRDRHVLRLRYEAFSFQFDLLGLK